MFSIKNERGLKLLKKKWQQPTLEVLDISETMKGWPPPKNGGGGSHGGGQKPPGHGDDSGGDFDS